MKSSSMAEWIEKEFYDISLKDRRLNMRFLNVANGLSEKSDKNIARTFEDCKDIKACYRFFNNDNVSYTKILDSHRGCTLERVKASKRVLFIQDIVEFNYRNRPGTENLDYCSKNRKEDGNPGFISIWRDWMILWI